VSVGKRAALVWSDSTISLELACDRLALRAQDRLHCSRGQMKPLLRWVGTMAMCRRQQGDTTALPTRRLPSEFLDYCVYVCLEFWALPDGSFLPDCENFGGSGLNWPGACDGGSDLEWPLKAEHRASSMCDRMGGYFVL